MVGRKNGGDFYAYSGCKKQGYKVMLKPYVWERHGSFTGHHGYETNQEWNSFEAAYSNYILTFAKLAQEEKAELLCIGTVWGKFLEERPEYWKQLIKEVKKIYTGKLTYATNWYKYKKVKFWDQLNYIGVDAYFHLMDEITPTSAQVKYALLDPLSQLQIFRNANNRPILFTEFGYRGVDKMGSKPREAGREGTVNLKAQINAYTAFFESFWNQEFVEVGFNWKWFAIHENAGGENNNGFTPQNKPEEKVIKDWYSL